MKQKPVDNIAIVKESQAIDFSRIYTITFTRQIKKGETVLFDTGDKTVVPIIYSSNE